MGWVIVKVELWTLNWTCMLTGLWTGLSSEIWTDAELHGDYFPLWVIVYGKVEALLFFKYV